MRVHMCEHVSVQVLIAKLVCVTVQLISDGGSTLKTVQLVHFDLLKTYVLCARHYRAKSADQGARHWNTRPPLLVVFCLLGE